MDSIIGGAVDLEGLIKAGTLLGVKHVEQKTGTVGLGDLITPFIGKLMADANIPTTLNVSPEVWALGRFLYQQFDNYQVKLANQQGSRNDNQSEGIG